MGTAIGVPASAITRLTLTVTRPVLAPMRMARDETRSLLAAQLEVMALLTTATLPSGWVCFIFRLLCAAGQTER